MFERYLWVHSIFHGCQFWMTEHLVVGPVFQSLFIRGLRVFSCCFGLFWKGSVFLPHFRTFWRNKELCHRWNTQLQALEQDSSTVFDWIFFFSERVFFEEFIFLFLFFFCCWSVKYPPLKGNLGIMDPALVWYVFLFLWHKEAGHGSPTPLSVPSWGSCFA